VNTASERYCAELKIAPANPRSSAGNQAAMMRPQAGATGASSRPSTTRSTKMAITGKAT
jgi:hypothetical protein